MRRVRAAIWTGLVVLAGGVACGGGDSNAPPDSHHKTVLVVNNEFQPVSVTIPAGDTVIWSWPSGSVEHNVLSNGGLFTDKGDSVGTVIGVDRFNNPTKHEVKFSTPGTYRYFCSAHGTGGVTNTGMAGTVIVN